MSEMNCSGRQFALFRIALGLFLATHFFLLAPFAGEIYGPTGMYASAIRSPFPNALHLVPTDSGVAAVVASLGLLSLVLIAGVQRRVVAVVLWYGWVCLTNRVPTLYVPSEGLVGWMLLLVAIAPSGEGRFLPPRTDDGWRLPPRLLGVVWLVLGIGYFASGIDKLASPSWMDGTAVRTILTSPVGRWDAVAHLTSELPDGLVRGATWSVLAFELSFLALIWNRWTRMWAWVLATLFHLMIRLTLDLHTVTDPFLVAQILLFDRTWSERLLTARRYGSWSKLPLRTM